MRPGAAGGWLGVLAGGLVWLGGAASAEPAAEPASSPQTAEGASDETGPDESVVAPADAAPPGGSLFEAAVSEASSSSEPDGEPAVAPRLEWSGHVRADVWAGKQVGADEADVKTGVGELSLRLRARLGALADVRGEVRVRAGSEFGSPAATAELREAYADLFAGPVDVRAGRQIIAWGRADGLNPTDNLTPRSWRIRSASLDDSRTGNLALRARAWLRPASLEAVWVPVPVLSELPPFTFPEQVGQAPAAQPGAGLLEGTYAVRAHLETSRFEGSVSYLRGWAPFPGLQLRSFELLGKPPVVVGFRAWRQQVVGLDFALPVGSLFGLRGEAALRLPREDADAEWAPLPDVQAVLGADREVVPGLTVVLQYVAHWVRGWTRIEPVLPLEEGATVTPEQLLDVLVRHGTEEALHEALRDQMRLMTRLVAQQGAPLAHKVSAAVRWRTLHETLGLEAGVLVNVTTREWTLRPVVSWSIADGLELSAGAELYRGPPNTLFALMQDLMSAGFLGLRASF